MNPSKITENLLEVAKKLEAATDPLTSSDTQARKEALDSAIDRIGRSWCGSFLGYHARTYLQGFRPATGADFFDREWGIEVDGYCSKTTHGWGVYADEDVKAVLAELANEGELSELTRLGNQVHQAVDRLKGQLCAILSATSRGQSDEYLGGLKEKAEHMFTWADAGTVGQAYVSGRTFMSRDSAATSEGLRIPPHLQVQAQLVSAFSPVAGAMALAEIARQAAEYLQIRDHLEVGEERTMGGRIFIGHGRSQAWRELKDFLTGRLHLEYEEFNREPVAGISTTERLSTMLNECCFALLVLTAEDVQADGSVRARENVVHEVGLFQGRHGFRKAIVLLEKGCNEFSNVHGLGHIPFEKGHIGNAFEEIRRVFEREGILAA